MSIVGRLSELLRGGRIADVYILSRYTYRIGNPIVHDGFYDKLERYCKDNGIATEYTSRTYDDDPIPYELLKEFELESIVPVNNEERLEYYKYLDEEKSLSIEPVTEYDEAYKYFLGVKGQNLRMSLKIDGIYTKRLIKEMEMKLALSRGRTGEAWDLTEAFWIMAPRYYPSVPSEVKVYSEGFCVPESLEYLAGKYDPNTVKDERRFKTEKSSAISMLRNPKDKDKEDYQFVRTLAFGADGFGTETIGETLDKLKELGFETVPNLFIPAEEVPTEFVEFADWLRDKLDQMWRMGMGIPSDGVVVDVDNLGYVAEIKNQYSSRNIALKLEHWSFDYYPGIVTDILIDQRRVECACKVTIEPVIARDRTKATTINCFNPKILIDNGIKKGSKIYFERNSGAVNILLHGGKMKQIQLDEPGSVEREVAATVEDMGNF